MKLDELLDTCAMFTDIKVIECVKFNGGILKQLCCRGNVPFIKSSLRKKEKRFLNYTVKYMYLIEQTLVCEIIDPEQD